MLDKIEQLTLGMRTVLDSAAHDLRTPLNRLQSTAEAAMMQLTVGSAERRVLERVTTEVDRMRSTLDALLRIATRRNRHGGAGTGQSVGIGRERGRTVRAGERRARQSYWRVSVASGAEVLGSRQLLAQALANLLDNAIKFTPDGGHIRVQLRGSGSEPEVIVEDNGPGIPADKRENRSGPPRAVGRGAQISRVRGSGCRWWRRSPNYNGARTWCWMTRGRACAYR